MKIWKLQQGKRGNSVFIWLLNHLGLPGKFPAHCLPLPTPAGIDPIYLPQKELTPFGVAGNIKPQGLSCHLR